MSNNIKSAFEHICADHFLKQQTKDFVYKKTNGYNGYKKRIRIKRVRYTVAFVSMAAIVIGGYVSYNIPVTAISMDINPSIELYVNLYDRVINVKSYSEDILENNFNVDNMKYDKAISCILNSDIIAEYLNFDNNILRISVINDSQTKCENIENNISSNCGIKEKNIYCTNDRETIDLAHEAGISCGKYNAFLELQKVNPDITVEDVKGLTMREINDMINGQIPDNTENCQGNGLRHGNSYKHGKKSSHNN